MIARRPLPFAALIAAGCLLTACESETAPPPAEDDGRAAEGEVLGGTISDDMLPLDTLRSQSPPQRIVAADSAASSDGETTSEESGEPASEAAAAPAEDPAQESEQAE